MKKWTLAALFLLLASVPPHLHAADAPADYDASQPIEITAQQLEADRAVRRSIFRGDVVAVQGDMTLRADTLTVYFLEEQNRIDRLIAEGHVRVEQLDRIATADEAIYSRVDEVLTLKGNAQVEQGQNRVNGTEIVLYLNENRTLVKGSEQGRVKAIFSPEAGQ